MDKIFNSCCICGTGGIVCSNCSKVYFKIDKNLYSIAAIYPIRPNYELDRNDNIIKMNTTKNKFGLYMLKLFTNAMKNKKKLYKIYMNGTQYFNPLLYILISGNKEYIESILDKYRQLQVLYNLTKTSRNILKIGKIHKRLSKHFLPTNLADIHSSIKCNTIYDNERFFSKCMFCEDGNFLCENCSKKIFLKDLSLANSLCCNFYYTTYGDINKILPCRDNYYIHIYDEQDLVYFAENIEGSYYTKLIFTKCYDISKLLIILANELFIEQLPLHPISNFLIGNAEKKYINPLLYLLLPLNEERASEIINAHEEISKNYHLVPSNKKLLKIPQIKLILEKYNVSFVKLSDYCIIFNEENKRYMFERLMFDDNLFPTFEQKLNNFKNYIESNIDKKVISLFSDLLHYASDDDVDKLLIDSGLLNSLANNDKYIEYIIKSDNVNLWKYLNIRNDDYLHILYINKARKIINYILS